MLATLPAPSRLALASLLVASVVCPDVHVKITRHNAIRARYGTARIHVDADGIYWWRTGTGASVQSRLWADLDPSAALHKIGASLSTVAIVGLGSVLALVAATVLPVAAQITAIGAAVCALWCTEPEHRLPLSPPRSKPIPRYARRSPATVRIVGF